MKLVSEFERLIGPEDPSQDVGFLGQGKWIVDTKGGPNQRSFEISVLREDRRAEHSDDGEKSEYVAPAFDAESVTSGWHVL